MTTETQSESESQDVKVAVIGNVDSGKSTLVGVLTKGVLDDGRGQARKLVFNFSHEQDNGRTSSISLELMGFNTKSGDPITSANADIPMKGANVTHLRKTEWPLIIKKSDKLVTFIDLCGHERYLKTTIFGLMGLYPDYAMIVVNANSGMQRMSKEHLGIAVGLQIPVFVVITKVDMTPQNVFDQTISDLSRILKSPAVRRLPVVIRGASADQATIESAAQSMVSNRVCPVICVSSVTGEGITQLNSFLMHLTGRIPKTFGRPESPVEFQIDSAFTVPGLGIVVNGTVKSGCVQTGQTLQLGPDKTGNFRPVVIRSMHCKRVPADSVTTGGTASLALRPTGKNKDALRKGSIRKGTVLLHAALDPVAHWEFDADVIVMHHATTIKVGYQAMIHCGVVRQTAKVTGLQSELMRTGDKAVVSFRFMYTPEWIVPGETVLFREGRTKGLGRITAARAPAKFDF